MAFDLGAMLKEVSESDTGREQIEYIRLDLLDSDEKNFYSLSEIPALADNIATVGLQQPLRVRKHPTTDGMYMIVSGHRRRAALELLVKEDPQRWSEVACIVQRDAVSPALQQLQLIYANSGTRKLSSSDMNEQAAQVEKLLYQLQQEGHEFPGRMRDHVAKVMQTTNTKLATLKKIRKHLAECWQQYYKSGELAESTAYELAKMTEEDQQLIFDAKKASGKNIKWLYADDVAEYVNRFNQIRKIKCSIDGAACENAQRMQIHAVGVERYWDNPCKKCCSDCSDLSSCKYACPHMADKVKQLKADNREANRQAKLNQEERDRPTIELLQRLWFRFGYAREQAGVSIRDACAAANYFYSSSTEKDVTELENCTAKFNVNNTDVPYGSHYHRAYIKALCALADLFGCSVDYLLCRSDVPEMAGSAATAETPEAPAATQAEFIPGNWYPASVEPPIDSEIVMVDRWECVDYDTYLGAGTLKNPVCMDWKDVVLWSFVPKQATASALPESSGECFPSLEWIPGHDLPVDPVRALAWFDMLDGYPPVELTVDWNGSAWQHRDGVIVDGQLLRWYPLPPKKIPERPALNNSCKTGMSPSGHCGAAACCEEPVDCCMNCNKACNLRCGHMEG